MKVLVVIDVQHDFVSGVLGTAEAQRIIPAVKQRIAKAEERGDLIIYTQDTHGADYLETQEGRKLPVVHCVKGTEGWEILPEVRTEGATVIEKSAFSSPHLAEYLRQYPTLEGVELIGLCTDICVISNAFLLKSFYPELPITVYADACAGVTPENHMRALDAMKVCQIEVIEG